MLVCGGREFYDADFLFDKLDSVHEITPIKLIIEGGANGADSLAREWAKSREVEYDEYMAQWKKFGKAAGRMRNEQMLVEAFPDVVIAFDGGNGTAHMKRIAREAQIKVVEFSRLKK